MATHKSSGETGVPHGADAAVDTFQLMEQGLGHLQEAERKIQKALRLQKQDAEQNILEAQCLRKQEVEQMIQEALDLQKQEAEQITQEALRLQEQKAKKMIQEALDLQKQKVEQKIQEALRLQKQEAEQKLKEALRLQERAEHRMQEALRLQEQRAATALCEMQLELQEKNAVILTLQQRLQETQERVAVLQEKTTALEASDGQRGIQRLVDRVEKVETFLQSATQTFVPRVEALLRQLEKPQSTRASLATATASSTTSTRKVTVTGGAAAGSGEEPQPPETLLAPTYTSTLAPSVADHQREAADEEERERQLVNRRMEELELRVEQTRNSPCPLGKALCEAAHRGSLSDVRRLIESGADVNYVDTHYCTPLLHAVWNNDAEKVSFLLQRGADPNALDISGYSALHTVAERGNSGQLVYMLVEAGGVVNARCESGGTPLHYAGHYNREAIVLALLAVGARRDLKPWDGEWKNKTPFDIATTSHVRNLLRL